MSKDLGEHVLYAEGSNVPVICERPDWKKCPDHKFLSESPSGTAGSGFDAELVEASNADLVDDANDNIVSVNEYASGSEESKADSLLRRSYRYDTERSAADELVESTLSLEGREGEPFKKRLNSNLYEMRVMGVGENFGVDYMRNTMFGNHVGKCDQCGKRVKIGSSGRWVHGGNNRRCPSVTYPIDFAN